MKTHSLALRVASCTRTECEVDVSNEFLTLFCRRHPDGTAMCTSWSRWSTDSPGAPSLSARAEAEKVATEAMNKMREEARQS